MQDCQIDGHLMASSLSKRQMRRRAKRGGQEAGSEASAEAEREEESQRESIEGKGPKGLLVNHAYAVLDVRVLSDLGGQRMIKVRNPWGRLQGEGWSGDWGSRSMLWQAHPAAAKELNYRGAEAEPGVFWITYEDFVVHMNRLYICRIFPLHWHNLTVRPARQRSSTFVPVSSTFVPVRKYFCTSKQALYRCGASGAGIRAGAPPLSRPAS
jgi:hypothetical protein